MILFPYALLHSFVCVYNFLPLQLVKLARGILGLKLFRTLMKLTVYGHFVAGEDLQAIRPLIERYRMNGVRAILDYAVEDDIPSSDVVLETRYRAFNLCIVL